MNHRLMNFNTWSLNEAVVAKAGDIAGTVKDIVGDKYGELYVVPDFETFSRPGEPEQTSTLFGSSSGVSFALNYDGDKLFSVDYWDKDSVKPDVTIYADGSSLESVMKAIVEGGKANEAAGDSAATPLVLYVVDDEDGGKKKKLTVIHNTKVKKEINKEADKDAEKFKTVMSVSQPEVAKKGEVVKTDQKSGENEYEFGDPKKIFKELEDYTDMVISGDQPSLLITGMAGVGKTFTVEKQMKKAGLKKNVDYFHAKGKSTAAGMYQVLWANNGKIIIFDDMDSIFRDENAVNILKGALDSEEVREISWISAKAIKTPGGETVPPKFDFTGRVIFISNLPQSKIDDAIKSRSFVIEVALSPKDMIGYIEGLMNFIMPYERVSLKLAAMKVMKEAAEANPNVEINVRTFQKAVKIWKSVPNKEAATNMIIRQCSYK